MWCVCVYILIIFNVYSFSTVAIVMPSHRSVMLHVHMLYVMLLLSAVMCMATQDIGHTHSHYTN